MLTQPTSSSFSQIFNELLYQVVSGRYAAGSRLPAERELAQSLATSRSTLREAIRQLEQWRLVEPRRGSGIVVRDRSEWSIRALPAYLAVSLGRTGSEARGLLADLLTMRRTLLLELVRLVSARASSARLESARRALQRAWEARHEPTSFVREDYQIGLAILRGAEFLPALWLLNDLADVYFELADKLGQSALPPPDYSETWHAVLDAIEAGDANAACARLGEYLLRTDQRLLAAAPGNDLASSAANTPNPSPSTEAVSEVPR